MLFRSPRSVPLSVRAAFAFRVGSTVVRFVRFQSVAFFAGRLVRDACEPNRSFAFPVVRSGGFPSFLCLRVCRLFSASCFRTVSRLGIGEAIHVPASTRTPSRFLRLFPPALSVRLHFYPAVCQSHKVVSVHSFHPLRFSGKMMPRPHHQIVPPRRFPSSVSVPPVGKRARITERIFFLHSPMRLFERRIEAQDDSHRHPPQPFRPSEHLSFIVPFLFGAAQHGRDERRVAPFVFEIKVGRFAEFLGR